MTNTLELTGAALRDEYLVVFKGWRFDGVETNRVHLSSCKPHKFERYAFCNCSLNAPNYHTDLGLAMEELIERRHKIDNNITEHTVAEIWHDTRGTISVTVYAIEIPDPIERTCTAILRALIEAKGSE